jgi:alkylhydroperoxidase/carboxymuconolactone decarboxylase family protein YurZ
MKHRMKHAPQLAHVLAAYENILPHVIFCCWRSRWMRKGDGKEREWIVVRCERWA